MSGFTTTGATILPDVQILPKGLLFWRSLTHWLGGMGIVTLSLAIFPAMGVAAYQMFRGEVPGPSADKLQPRLAETAKILWGVYILLSVAETLLLMAGGMPLFDSLCHTFGTMATGGFSTKNASIGYYKNPYFDWVIILFMFLAGTNFLLHYRVLIQGRFKSLKEDREFHFYTFTILISIAFVSLFLYFNGLPPEKQSASHYRHNPMTTAEMTEHVEKEAAKVSSAEGAFRFASFQVVSITTTTGFCTADFDVWPNICRLLLLVLMFWGGCAGSTGGGMKMVRIMVVLKAAYNQLRKIGRPRLISLVKVGKTALQESLVANILAFFVLYMFLFILSTVFMTLFVPDLVTAIATVSATLGNIGPGLAGIGAIENYAWIPVAGKWILILCMLLGRLEIFTVLLIFRPSIWKK